MIDCVFNFARKRIQVFVFATTIFSQISPPVSIIEVQVNRIDSIGMKFQGSSTRSYSAHRKANNNGVDDTPLRDPPGKPPDSIDSNQTRLGVVGKQAEATAHSERRKSNCRSIAKPHLVTEIVCDFPCRPGYQPPAYFPSNKSDRHLKRKGHRSLFPQESRRNHRHHIHRGRAIVGAPPPRAM